MKNSQKCSPEFCNFKGACELKSTMGKQIPTCKCKDTYTGPSCNKCKISSMQFPGCHTPKTTKLISESAKELMTTVNKLKKDRIKQQCKNTIPPTVDTFEHIRYNGEATISGVFSLSEINNEIGLTMLNKASMEYKN